MELKHEITYDGGVKHEQTSYREPSQSNDSSSYNYLVPLPNNNPLPGSAWNSNPSPYAGTAEHRPRPPELANHQSPYTLPTQPYPPPPSPSGRETLEYPSDSGYGPPRSVSAPRRLPAEVRQPPYYPMSTNPRESPYYPPADYKPRYDYQGPPAQTNGVHQPPHVVTAAHGMIPGQPGPPPHGPPSTGPSPYASNYGHQYPFLSGERRNPVRAAQACDWCRKRKAKCDEGRPECQHCKDNGLKCSYQKSPPPISEKQTLQVISQLEALTEDVKGLTQSAQKYEQRQETLERYLKQLETSMKSQEDQMNLLLEHFLQDRSTPTEVSMSDVPQSYGISTQERPVPAGATPQMFWFRRQDGSDARYTSPVHYPSMAPIQHAQTTDSDSEDTPMPAKHTTAAQNLLTWPSISILIPKGITRSYVMDEEAGRGLLRLYGYGEGEDKGDGHEGAPSPANSSSSDVRRLDEETSSSPHGVWGSGQLHVPTTSHNFNASEHPGGSSPNGKLALDSNAVDKHFRSFMDNMHILHPFLEPKVLRNMVHTFKRKYSWDFRATQQVATIGTKRKRSPDSPGPMEVPQGYQIALIEHSVANAIVLLVLALGKVAAHRDPLPGPVSTYAVHTSTPDSAMDLGLPMVASAPTSPFNNHVTPNGMVSSPVNPQGRNMDVIPGLAYFAKASSILGELPGGADVSHIQSYLLAGLYMGQLARIIPSYFYINKACIAAQILIESTPYTTNTMKPAQRNLINFAYWSCLQLESDIAAELELPLSGIGRYESRQHTEFPTNITLDPIPESSTIDDILRFYSYQIQLRTTMNSIHAMLYRETKNLETGPSPGFISALDKNLEYWRRTLGDFGWDDRDHEHSNINVARMRGKYYGAKYIIWRPILRYALTQALENTTRKHLSDSPVGPNQGSEVSSPSTPGLRDTSHIRPDLLHGASKCIEAAIRSTTSFDKVPRRLVVTNIFGTVHAQFGNMLVMYATFTSPHPELSGLVKEDVLRRLHDRTMDILRENKAISPVLAKNLKILEHVKRNVFPSRASSAI